jgi:zinc/manganese transport system substrate-binding protein
MSGPSRAPALRRLMAWVASALVLGVAVPVRAEVRVVTTSPSLEDLVRQVGGELVEAESLMRGPENPHNVVPKPSFVMKVRGADLFVHGGLDGEPWVANVVRGTRRAKFLQGGEANVDASRGIALLEVPSRGAMTRAMGDIHVHGNPHYLLDPLNGITVGRTLADALSRVDPDHAADYARGADDLEARLRAMTAELLERLAPAAGRQVVVYHRTWSYFLERFGLRKLAEVESKPGIAPGPQHIAQLAEKMRAEAVGLVLLETYSNVATAERLAELAGGRTVLLAQDVDAIPEVETYAALFEFNVEALLRAWRELGEPVPAAVGGPDDDRGSEPR